MLTEPTIPIELNTYSERSETRDHARGSNHPPCYGAPIWLKRLIWLYCFLSILVFVVRLPMVHERKQNPQLCVPVQTQQKKKSKREKKEGSDVFEETRTNYDMPSWHDCTITLFELVFFWLFFLINLSLILLFCALCSTAKFCYFSDWLKFY